MPEYDMIINDDLLETIHYNSPTTPIKASYTYLSDFPGGVTPCHWHRELECIVMIRSELLCEQSHIYFTRRRWYHRQLEPDASLQPCRYR